MRILFDQGVPVPLRRCLPGHEIATAFEMGWANWKNGDLLRAAENRFELFVTSDKNLRYQQNLAGRRLSILVLPTTNWLEIRNHESEVVQAVHAMRQGECRQLYW